MLEENKVLPFALGKKEIISLIHGTDVPYNLMEHPLIKPYSYYCGGFKDEFKWERYKLSSLSLEALTGIYVFLKLSGVYNE